MKISNPGVSVTIASFLGFACAFSWLLFSRTVLLTHAQSGTRILRVATTGSDTPSCGSQATPCRTLQYAVNLAQAGDEIRLAGGTYTGVQSHFVPPDYPYPPSSGSILQVVYISKTVTIRGGYTGTFSEPPDPQGNPTTLDAQ